MALPNRAPYAEDPALSLGRKVAEPESRNRTPFARDRAMVRHLLEPGEFVEVHLNAPLAVCEQRDPKGLYRKARAGEIRHVTPHDMRSC